MFFTEEFTPRLSDAKPDGTLSPEAILQIFETIGTHQALKVGDIVVNENLSWIQLQWYFKVFRLPKVTEKLLVTTWGRGNADSLIINRDYVMKSETGEELIGASGKFGILDLEHGKMLRVSAERFNKYQPESRQMFDNIPVKLVFPDFIDDGKPIFLRKSDMDFNNHVHNTKYIDFALNALPDDVYEKNNITEYRIDYRLGVTLKDKPVIKSAFKDGAYYFGIYSNGKLCTTIFLK